MIFGKYSFMLALYRLSVWMYEVMAKAIALFNHKAGLFVDGRKSIFERLESAIEKDGHQLVWIHTASVGEFEQGRPIIEEFKKGGMKTKILLTFFSPSGYELRKNYELADYVFYLPMDAPTAAKRFISITQPDLAIFIKYEFWYFYLKELQNMKVPTFQVSCVLRKNHFFFGRPGKFYKQVLKGIDHYFVQDEESAKLLETIGVTQCTVAGDTRFDRVSTVASQAKEIPVAKAFKGDEKLMVLGSTWPSDIDRVREFLLKYIGQLKFIIAPHNIEEKEIQQLLELPDSITFSEADESLVNDKRILIIDNIGMLSSLYRYGDFAYVGGSFNGTLHNTLEAAVYGIPVYFGNDVSNAKFLEAKGLILEDGGFEIEDSKSFEQEFLKLWNHPEAYEKASRAASQFVETRKGATKKVMNHIKKVL